MEGLTIINYVDINGEDVLMDELPEDKRLKVAEAIQDRMMAVAGYRRNTA